MYKVVIVDDEPLTVRSLKSMIESIDAQFKVVEIAYDGKSGLEIIERINPDLIFMDINMPIYDGLDVISRLKKKGISSEIIILSGYQEFEYAKKAITLGVADYMVKPLNPVILEEQLQILKKSLENNAKKFSQTAFESLFFSNEAVKKQPEFFKEDSKFCIVKICFNAFNFIRNNQFSGGNDECEITILKHHLQEIFKENSDYWILSSRYSNEFLLVVSEDEFLWKKKIEELFMNISSDLPKDHSVTFVVGSKAKKWQELREEFVDLEEILYCNAVFGKSKLFTDTSDIASYEVRQNRFDYIDKLIQKGNIVSIQEQLRLMLYDCEKDELTEAALIKFLKKIMSLVCDDNSYETDFIINSILISSYCYSDVESKMAKNVAEYIERRKSVSDKDMQSIINDVTKYLDEHFGEKILIQDVASQFNLNYSYLCSQFKKSMRVSPNEYMLMKRIEKAKSLLENCEDLSIKDIAEMVGYSDQYYFSRIFKIYEKKTPSDYKKEKGQVNEND